MRGLGTVGITIMGRADARDRIITALIQNGAASRAELARRTSLAPSTVSAIISELLGEGLVVEQATQSVRAGTKGGRPATLVALDRSAGVAVGIDIGKQHVRVAVADLAHQLLAERSENVTPDLPASEGIRAAAALVHKTLGDAAADLSHVVGVGMGLPGPVHAPTGQLGDSTILPGWVGVNAAQAMTDALGLRVEVDNDANLGAIGEWTWGAGRDCTEVIYLKLATGIGAGLIIGGRPFTGHGGTAGEIGHTVVDPAGPICRCGNRGCLEMLAGSGAVLNALRPSHGNVQTIAEVLELAAAGDHGCRRAIADAGQAVGTAAATLCNLINPRLIVVGGEMAAAGEILIDPLREALERGAIRSASHDVEVVQGTLGDRAEVLGAVALALRHGNQPLTASAG
ncbi:putative NBD/HSP70 family sugar kinase [Kribbella sp. VKM Ac-2527]|uniref:Putative NBD/HSP70 family sugar kinase n=1 Tax=Kribbella caucasensis TaxID=2512215 RepID=A0A4R6KK77_9ACTN|nr:ROK family transcriptional regulator [Kribbella sp. VKM Ac-2527]TDO51728.1 putative NBD/HSP70 family sugar kinase [Kribbella sp. VKM Ac-2527]